MPEPNGRTYCLDSSSIIAAWHERYPPAHFQSFWASLQELSTAERVISPEEVAEEIGKRDPALRRWAEDQADFFVALDESQQVALRDIMARFPRLVKAFSSRNRADPFVIALAKVRNAVVVCEEGPGSPKKPKIPDICRRLQVPQIGLVQMIRDEGWTF